MLSFRLERQTSKNAADTTFKDITKITTTEFEKGFIETQGKHI